MRIVSCEAVNDQLRMRLERAAKIDFKWFEVACELRHNRIVQFRIK